MDVFNSSAISYVVANTIENVDYWLVNVSVYFDVGRDKRVLGTIICTLQLDESSVEEVVDVDVIPNSYEETVAQISFSISKVLVFLIT